MVTISGAIKRPALFELTEDNNLSDLIEYADGFADNANLETLRIERPSKEGGGVKLLTLRMLIVGTYMIQYGHTDRTGKADAQLRDRFLASLQVD